MKNIVLFAVLSVVLSACVKDKFENQTDMFVGKWTWHHSVHYTYDSANDTIVGTTISISDYPDVYGFEFVQKGKVHFLKNGDVESKYRNVLPTFKVGICDEIPAGNKYEILLNNKKYKSLSGCINADTLVVSDTSFTHLPIARGTGDTPYYDHYFVRN